MVETEDLYLPNSRQALSVQMFLPFGGRYAYGISPCPNHWKALYRAAILETNKGLLPQRVSEAEEAVKARGCEIFYSNGTPEEREAEALEDALYTLRAFRTAWQHNEPA